MGGADGTAATPLGSALGFGMTVVMGMVVRCPSVEVVMSSTVVMDAGTSPPSLPGTLDISLSVKASAPVAF